MSISGEYGDLSFGGVGHEFADLILRVEAAVAFWGAVASGARWMRSAPIAVSLG